MIKAGAMREVITFERKIETVQPSGAVIVRWIEEQTLRAELVQETAEAFLAATERTEDRKVFRLWSCPSVTQDMRLNHAGSTYCIRKLFKIGPLELELHCSNTQQGQQS